MVDDDESVRESLPDLVKELGFRAEAFESAEAFLKSDHFKHTECLILDLSMPGMDGNELAAELKAKGIAIPIIFITANHSEAARLQMESSGAIAYLYKPFSDVELADALALVAQRRGKSF